MIQVLFLILIWVLPALLMMNTYVKMNESEKQSFKVELKQPIVFFTVVFLLFGLLISLSGIILAIKWVQHLGVIMVFVSWFTISILSWKRGKTKLYTSAMLLLLGLIGVSIYCYFFMI